MADPERMTGKGTTIGYSNTAEGAPTVLAKMRDIKPPEKTQDDVDVTCYDDVGEVTIAGLVKNGTCDVTILYTKARSVAIEALFGLQKYWTITAPDGGKVKFQGHMNKLGTEFPLGDGAAINVSVKADGNIVLSA